MTVMDVSTVLDELHSYIRRHVVAGYLQPAEIAAFAAEVFADELDEVVLRHHARRYTSAILAEQRAEEATWPAVTDCDRLDAAFAALEREGVVARQQFSCCGSCGAAEIWGEMAAAEEAGLAVRGYVFFHLQDTEAAVEGEGLYLSYGAVAEGPEAAEAIGRAVMDALEAKGLDPVWDGEWTRRIFVPIEWRRRLRERAGSL
jgi:hypothetical protein